MSPVRKVENDLLLQIFSTHNKNSMIAIAHYIYAGRSPGLLFLRRLTRKKYSAPERWRAEDSSRNRCKEVLGQKTNGKGGFAFLCFC